MSVSKMRLSKPFDTYLNVCSLVIYIFPLRKQLLKECIVNRNLNLSTKYYLPLLFSPFFLYILTFSCRAMISNNTVLAQELQKQNLIGVCSLSL